MSGIHAHTQEIVYSTSNNKIATKIHFMNFLDLYFFLFYNSHHRFALFVNFFKNFRSNDTHYILPTHYTINPKKSRFGL